MSAESKKFYKDGFMDLSKYRLERVRPDAEWDALVARSAQGTLFVTSDLLGALEGVQLGTWRIYKDRQPVGGLAVIESPDGHQAIENDFVIYSGVLLEPPPPEQSQAQTIAEQFRVTSYATERLAELYRQCFVSLPPGFTDIRPFLWHNYGQDGQKFVPDIRFTSTIALAPNPGGKLESDPLYVAASKSRRQQIRYGINKGVATEISTDVSVFVDLYAQTFARQDRDVDQAYLRQLRAICERLIAVGKGRLYLSRTADGSVGSAALFGWDNKRAYYVYGANAPDLRDDHTGTMVLWEAFQDLRNMGIAEIDLEGINSPLRGHFKLSFGGTITPYYHLSLR
jgi:hypothetical protein